LFTLCNPAYQTLVGETRKVIGRTVADAIPEAREQGFLALLDQVMTSGVPYVGRRIPFTAVDVAGAVAKPRYLDFVYQPILDATGKPTGVFLEGHDVTDQVESERLLELAVEQRDAQARIFDIALSSIQDFTYTFDREHRFTYCNRALLALLGLRLDEVVGKSFLELPYERGLAQQLCDEIENVFTSRRQVVGVTYYMSPTGSDGHFEYIFNPVFSPNGAVVAVAGSTRDITQRLNQERMLAELIESERTARADAERASRMKDDFLATLSHELRTPLNAILGWAEVLRSGKLSPEKMQDGLERIARNSRVQAQLIADLLDVNAIVTGKVHLNRERIQLQTPLLAAFDSVRLDASNKGVSLVLSKLDGERELFADSRRLQQVFSNLLTNALKFTEAGGSVDISADFSEDAVVIVFADTGIGIKPDFLSHLFERFSQADSTSTRGYGGLGLGLSICKSLVELHDGDIVATSPGHGKGSTFSVTLPLSLESEPVARLQPQEKFRSGAMPSDDEARALRGRCVLVVDDDHDGASMLITLLGQYGAETVFAQSAEEALSVIEATPVALMLLDIGMPKTDGYELLRQARKTTQAPAIALTAFSRPQDRQRASDAGFHAHVSKPIEPAIVVALCAEVLRVTLTAPQ